MIYGTPRELREAPASSLDAGGLPRFGSYAGGLDRVELPRRSPVARFLRHKRWMYVAASDETTYVAFAAVHVGYATNAFFFVYDARTRSMIARTTILGHPHTVRWDDALPRSGSIVVQHRNLRARLRMGSEVFIEVTAGDVRFDATLEPSAMKPITAIARLGSNGVQITEKGALLPCHARLQTKSGTRAIEGMAGYDYSNGLLERHTAWKWAYMLGQDAHGESVAMNLVSGFVGEAECAMWSQRGGLVPLSEGRFEFDAQEPQGPWKIRTSDGAHLDFRPGAMHAEHRNLGIVRSRFVQPVGAWSGTLPGIGEVTGLGVAEDQDVLW